MRNRSEISLHISSVSSFTRQLRSLPLADSLASLPRLDLMGHILNSSQDVDFLIYPSLFSKYAFLSWEIL